VLILPAVRTVKLVELRVYPVVLGWSTGYVVYNFDSYNFIIQYYMTCYFPNQELVWLQCKMFVARTRSATIDYNAWLRRVWTGKRRQLPASYGCGCKPPTQSLRYSYRRQNGVRGTHSDKPWGLTATWHSPIDSVLTEVLTHPQTTPSTAANH